MTEPTRTPQPADDDTAGTDAGIDPTLRAETASDPEVAAMVRALREDDEPGEDVRLDVAEASETIGTGTDR